MMKRKCVRAKKRCCCNAKHFCSSSVEMNTFYHYTQIHLSIIWKCLRWVRVSTGFSHRWFHFSIGLFLFFDSASFSVAVSAIFLPQPIWYRVSTSFSIRFRWIPWKKLEYQNWVWNALRKNCTWVSVVILFHFRNFSSSLFSRFAIGICCICYLNIQCLPNCLVSY